jgi:hypothetical protein
MKKLTCVLVAVFATCLALPVEAQHRIGVVGGLNFADADVEIENEPADVSSRTAFGIGGVVDLRLSEIFSLHFEPMYLQKGAGESELAIQPGVEWKLKSTHLELPLLLKAEFGTTVRPYVMAGPTIGILLSSDIEADFSGLTLKGDAKDASESIDFALAFGAGISYPLGKSSLFLEGRYSLGLTNNVKGGDVEIASGPLAEVITWDKETDEIKSRGFQIMAGVTFPLGSQ